MPNILDILLGMYFVSSLHNWMFYMAYWHGTQFSFLEGLEGDVGLAQARGSGGAARVYNNSMKWLGRMKLNLERGWMYCMGTSNPVLLLVHKSKWL